MQIETERFLLRSFSESDAADVLEYLRNPVPACFACMKLNSLEEAAAEMRKRSENSEFGFAIVLKETGKVIGKIEAFPERGEPDLETSPIDTFTARAGCLTRHSIPRAMHTRPPAHSSSISMPRARRIYAYTEGTNLRRRRLCEKLGMRREGLFIEFVSFVKNPDGTPRYENTFQYAILKREWDERKRLASVFGKAGAIRAQMAHSTENSDGIQD